MMRGEIAPGKEAMRLIESLESRLERRSLTDSLSATKHFLQSLKSSNSELRYKNGFDHSDAYRRLPPDERDFVYQRAVIQREQLEAKSIGASTETQMPARAAILPTENLAAKVAGSLRDALKGDLTELLTNNPGIGGQELTTRMSRIIETNLEKLGSRRGSWSAATSWSRDVGAGISQLLQVGIEHRSGAKTRDGGSSGRGTGTRSQTDSVHER